MSRYRKFIRHSSVGRGFTLQDLIESMDSSYERLRITEKPSITIRKAFDRLENIQVFKNKFYPEYLKFYQEAEREYKEQRVKATLALHEVKRLYEEEFPDATSKDKSLFLDEKMKEIYLEFHKEKTFEQL